MNAILITDNKEEMIRIGRELFKEKSAIYDDRTVNLLKKTIQANMPNATEKERQDTMYQAVYDYWVYGDTIDEEFYFGFLNKSHEEKSTYITYRSRMLYINHLNKFEDTYMLCDKYKAYTLLKPYYKREVIQISSENDFALFLDFLDRHPVFVAKPTSLGWGYGVRKVDSGDYENKRVLFDELLTNGSNLKKDYKWLRTTAVVLEEIIDQVEELARIHPHSVNGIRLTTIRIGDKVHMYYPWFKIGANGQFVTSAAIGTMDAGIDVNTGVVCTAGCKENGEQMEYHPQTGIRIPGYVIPQWDELLKMAEELALKFDTIRYVGWDFVLTPKGWCVMEGNYGGEFMWQMMYNKGMKKEFEELIGWKPEQDFWWQNK